MQLMMRKRSEIMEINDSNNLEALAEALRYFYEKDKVTCDVRIHNL